MKLAIIFASFASTGQAFATPKSRSLGFDPVTQAVSVTGSHAFQPPGPNDLRGPCPGLNAMANHGYIPRNGYTSSLQAIQGVWDVYGMSAEFGEFLSFVAASFAGDGFGYSIGGPPPPNLIAGGLLGQPLGLSYSHNRFEGDASLTRDDLYMTNDASTMRLSFFKQLLDLADEQGKTNIDLDLMADFAALRYNYSLYNNPYFFRGFVGALVPPGTNGLVSDLFSNKSAEYPEGYLNKENLKSFFAVTGDDDNLQYTPGHERIPENWYKRNPANPFTTVNFATDFLLSYLKHPENTVFGGNTGTVNSMTPVDLGNLTVSRDIFIDTETNVLTTVVIGRVYNSQNILKGNNLGCFLFQQVALNTPDLLTNGGVINDILGLVNGKMLSVVTNALSGLSCPQLAKFDDSQLNIFPGYKKDQTIKRP